MRTVRLRAAASQGSSKRVAHGYGALINGNTHPNYPGLYLTGAHEFGHIFGCDHCDAEWTDSTDGSLPGWSVMATGGAGVNCNKRTDKVVGRFGSACSERMISEDLEVNQLNRRSGANAGPTFGYELGDALREAVGPARSAVEARRAWKPFP